MIRQETIRITQRQIEETQTTLLDAYLPPRATVVTVAQESGSRDIIVTYMPAPRRRTKLNRRASRTRGVPQVAPRVWVIGGTR